MNKSSTRVIRGNTGADPESTENRPAWMAGVPEVVVSLGDLDDPRAESRGGRRLSGLVRADDVLGGPTSQEPGAGATARQPRLLPEPPVSAVPYGELRELAQSQIRRGCRPFDFDWDAFVADRPEWGITEVVHRRAVQEGRGHGLDLRPTDIPTDTVMSAVRDVIAEWTEQPELRPTYEDFCQEQARRGEKGRETQQALTVPRNARILALVQAGVSDAEIARRVRLHRSQVGRIRRAAEKASRALQEVVEAPAFPAPEVPPSERWPVVQFTRWTGVQLDEDDARWLADVGRCYEAEGREAELVDAIRASAGGPRDPWAYLQRCVVNRGDAWTVTPQLLGDVLAWAGQKSLEYALAAIGDGYVKRPLPYLRRTLQYAVSEGELPSGSPERPVVAAVAMARERAPELVIVEAEEAVAAEDVAKRVGHVESFRRRFGRLPWEAVVSPENAGSLDMTETDVCCIGLKGLWDDELNSESLSSRELESSGRTFKANATWVPGRPPDLEGRMGSPDGEDAGLVVASRRILGPRSLERQKLEHALESGDLPESDEILRPEGGGEALEPIGAAFDPLAPGSDPPFLEHGRCRHPLASLLTAGMVLDNIALVECVAGCGHRLYSDRGVLECLCHWPASKVARLSLAFARAIA